MKTKVFKVFDEIQKLTAVPFTLAAIAVRNWDRDLSPWPVPPVFRNSNGFPGGADAYLEKLTGTIVPEIKSGLSSEPLYTAIAGYSLAGLFAMYSLYRTDMFSRAASISGSLWYPGFAEFAMKESFCAAPDRIYLSVGDKEKSTRNSYMSKVEYCTEMLYGHYSSNGTDTVYELNKGDHFTDSALRTAKGIMAVMK